MQFDSYIISGFVLAVATALLLFFSAAEVAYTALLETSTRDLKERVDKRARRTEALLTNFDTLIFAVKLARWGTMVVLVSAAAFLALSGADRFGVSRAAAWLVATVVLTAWLFSISEVWARGFVLKNSLRFAEAVSWPLLLYYKAFGPATNLLARLLTSFLIRFNLHGNGRGHHRVLAMVDDTNGSDLEEDEREMIHSIIEFGEIEVHEIMIPRTDMVCVEEETDVKKLIDLIKERGHSRIPLYSEDVDNILGIIHVKDLLPYIGASAKTKQPNLKRLARPAYFVPETKKLDRLLQEFRQEKDHMAIVVDEYGGTAGLVTLEDVIEEIIGDIQDEYDQEAPLFRKLAEDVYDVDAKIGLDELNEELHINLPTDGDFETLGGFILSLTGYVPEEQEVVKYHNYLFLVEEVVRNRIKRVRLTLSPVEQKKNAESPGAT